MYRSINSVWQIVFEFDQNFSWSKYILTQVQPIIKLVKNLKPNLTCLQPIYAYIIG